MKYNSVVNNAGICGVMTFCFVNVVVWGADFSSVYLLCINDLNTYGKCHIDLILRKKEKNEKH